MKILILFLTIFNTNIFSTENISPIAHFTANKYELDYGETVAITSTDSIHPNGNIVKYEWFLDEKKLNQVNSEFEHRFYETKDSVELKLVVTDKYGKTASYKKEFKINPTFRYELSPNADKSIDITLNGISRKDIITKISWSINEKPIDYLTGSTITVRLNKVNDYRIIAHYRDQKNIEKTALLQLGTNELTNMGYDYSPRFKVVCIPKNNASIECRSKELNYVNIGYSRVRWESEGQKKYYENALFNYKDKGIKEIRFYVVGHRNEGVLLEKNIKIDLDNNIEKEFLVNIEEQEKKRTGYRIKNTYTFNNKIFNKKDIHYSYKWFLNGDLLEGNSNVLSLNFEKIGKNEIKLVVQDEFGNEDSDKIEVNVGPVPEVTF